MLFKRIFMILLATFIACIYNINAKNHVEQQLEGEKCDCDLTIDYVCATDHLTYTNECILNKCVAKYNPEIKFLHKGHCKDDSEVGERSIHPEKRQKRELRKHKRLHRLHQRKGLLAQKLKHKPLRAKFRVQKKFTGNLKKPFHGRRTFLNKHKVGHAKN